jgi:hypothetical protein
MAHLQLIGDLVGPKMKHRRPWLLYAGTRLYEKSGNTGDEKIGIHQDSQITLELAGTTDAAAKAKLIRSDDEAKVKVASKDRSPMITIKAVGVGKALLKFTDPAGGGEQTLLTVVAGDFKKYSSTVTKMDAEIDLVADVCRGSDAVKIHTLRRMLSGNFENIFNENWDVIEGVLGKRACGDVCEIGAESLWGGKAADAHVFGSYHIPFRPGTVVNNRDEVKYKEEITFRAQTAIKGWLAKNKSPVAVGIYFGGSSKTNRFGQLERTEGGGHTVLIVGCNKAMTQFLYIDPWNAGSKLKYEGGLADDKFTTECQQMGIIHRVEDKDRGPMLRQMDKTEGSFDTPGGDFLEVTSGP